MAARLDGAVAVVTGAARGIGRAVALRLAAEGATVTVADVDAPGARAVAGEIASAGGRADAEAVDLADPAQREALIGRVLAARGRVDVLVNNAAYLGERAALPDLSYRDWVRVLEINLAAAAFLSRDAAADMTRRGSGAIVNLASLHEHLPVPGQVAYAASKGGISALTRALAVEVAPYGVRVNAVVPAAVDTPAASATLAADGRERMPPATLLRRTGTPAEVAAAVVYLASDDAGYVTGELLRVDGGRGISRHPDPYDPDASAAGAPHQKHRDEDRDEGSTR